MNAPWLSAPDCGDVAASLRRDGYCVVHNLVDPDLLFRLSGELDERFGQVGFCDGLFFGHKTKRIHGLLKRTSVTAGLVLNTTVLRAANAVLLPHCDRIQLNLTQAIEIHPGELIQAPHRDQDMWQRAVPGIEYLVNVMWPLTPFTADNGATRIWSGTHRDLDYRRPAMSESTIAEMEPGDALLYLGSVIHGAGANVSGSARRGVVVSYALGWLKQFENMSLTYPPEIARNFPRDLTDLLGYRSHIGSLGSFDGRCPSELLRGQYDEFAGAREVMSPESREVLERFARHQDWISPAIAGRVAEQAA